MGFEPDVAVHFDRHQCDLQVSAAPDHGPIVLVLERRLFEIERLWLGADVLDGHTVSPEGIGSTHFLTGASLRTSVPAQSACNSRGRACRNDDTGALAAGYYPHKERRAEGDDKTPVRCNDAPAPTQV